MFAIAFVLAEAASAGGQEPAAPSPAQAIARGVELLVGMQESLVGGAPAEWPYEGVYRVRGEIPIGYRVGGTAIVALALVQAPGLADDAPRRDAIGRAVDFIVASLDHPLMSVEDYDGGYDVRGWGYTYAALFLARLARADAVPTDKQDSVRAATQRYLRAIEKTEIPEGGWSYSRAPGRGTPSPIAPFMTAPTLVALMEARAAGFEVDRAVFDRAAVALEKARAATGAFVYAGSTAGDAEPAIPGAIGRMVAAEHALFLCGRSSVASVRGAVDAFIVHWEWLEKRRAKAGTHAPPYGIAPYYFYFAHYSAAQAVELLPEGERAEYRRRLEALLFSTRQVEGTWNDRVFPRSRNFGTAMAVLSLTLPAAPRPASWPDPPALQPKGTSR